MKMVARNNLQSGRRHTMWRPPHQHECLCTQSAYDDKRKRLLNLWYEESVHPQPQPCSQATNPLHLLLNLHPFFKISCKCSLGTFVMGWGFSTGGRGFRPKPVHVAAATCSKRSEHHMRGIVKGMVFLRDLFRTPRLGAALQWTPLQGHSFDKPSMSV